MVDRLLRQLNNTMHCLLLIFSIMYVTAVRDMQIWDWEVTESNVKFTKISGKCVNIELAKLTKNSIIFKIKQPYFRFSTNVFNVEEKALFEYIFEKLELYFPLICSDATCLIKREFGCKSSLLNGSIIQSWYLTSNVALMYVQGAYLWEHDRKSHLILQMKISGTLI